MFDFIQKQHLEKERIIDLVSFDLYVYDIRIYRVLCDAKHFNILYLKKQTAIRSINCFPILNQV